MLLLAGRAGSAVFYTCDRIRWPLFAVAQWHCQWQCLDERITCSTIRTFVVAAAARCGVNTLQLGIFGSALIFEDMITIDSGYDDVFFWTMPIDPLVLGQPAVAMWRCLRAAAQYPHRPLISFQSALSIIYTCLIIYKRISALVQCKKYAIRFNSSLMPAAKLSMLG